MVVETIPAFIALLFKLALITYALRSPRRDATTRLFVVLLCLFSLHNLVEFVGLNYFATHGLDATMVRFGYSYFAIGILFLAAILHLSLRLSTDNWSRTKAVVPIIYLPVPLLEYLLLGTDKLVAGFTQYSSYTILRVPGPFYFLFETYAPIYLLAALAYLIYGARGSRASFVARVRNRLWLLGLAPLVLLNAYLIIANHFGLAKLSSTVSIPIAITFFLVVATYATHQYRLFDIEFYFPWSKVRRRKTAFYRRIQATVSEIAELGSVKEILDLLAGALQCQVALVGGPRPVIASTNGRHSGDKGDLLMSEFPQAVLRSVDHIVVTHEVADRFPDLHALMKKHKVGAVVPFNSHSSTATHWMLLGEHFSNEVYTPLDFKVVETLFDRIGERFLDNLLLLRSQLAEANDELRDYQRRLAIAWTELESLRRTLARTEEDNKTLRAEKATLVRQSFRVIDSGLPDAIESGDQTLAEYLAASERDIVRAALRDAGGNKIEAARLLGVKPRALHYLIQRHDLELKHSDDCD